MIKEFSPSVPDRLLFCKFLGCSLCHPISMKTRFVCWTARYTQSATDDTMFFKQSADGGDQIAVDTPSHVHSVVFHIVKICSKTLMRIIKNKTPGYKIF